MHDITDTEHLERLRDQFFAAAAHSLKTPVAVIKADVQSLMPAAAPHGSGRIAASIDAPVRPDRSPGAEPDGAVAVALADARAAPQRDGAPAAGRADRARRDLVLSARGPHRADGIARRSSADHERLALVIRNLIYEASRLSLADSPLTLVARPEGDRVAVGVRYQPLPWRDRVERDPTATTTTSASDGRWPRRSPRATADR